MFCVQGYCTVGKVSLAAMLPAKSGRADVCSGVKVAESMAKCQVIPTVHNGYPCRQSV